jgi:hypothetical protein
MYKGLILELTDRPTTWDAPSHAWNGTTARSARRTVPPAAIITAPSTTFRDTLTYSVNCLPGWMPAVFTEESTDGTPGHQRVRAFCRDAEGRMGPIVVAHFIKLDSDHTITLHSEYANQYAAGGNMALIDGIRGGRDFRTGEWQGYEGQDVSATVDLGAVERLKRAGVSALQDMKPWIWFPELVEISWSRNGRKWTSQLVVNPVDRREEGAITREFWTQPVNAKARFVRIKAKNAGPCPDWHPGKGGRTWIFLDEILIETE